MSCNRLPSRAYAFEDFRVDFEIRCTETTAIDACAPTVDAPIHAVELRPLTNLGFSCRDESLAIEQIPSAVIRPQQQ
jgi:hypothetical protein